MSGQWQRYPPSQGGYPQAYEYPQQAGYPQQSGWPQQGRHRPPNHSHEGYSHQNGYHAQTGPPYRGYGQYPQQQYGPPQGPPSQAPLQPQAFPQAGQYQPYTQQPHQQPGRGQTAQPSPSTCYNCGDPNHWAQDCPEPRRDVPHGISSQNLNRPPKRFKPNYVPPVITKYAVPPHVQAGQQALQAYGSPPNSAQSYHQQSPGYGLAPTSVQSPHPQLPQWPSSHSQHQQHQVPYIQTHSISPPQFPGPFVGPVHGPKYAQDVHGPTPGAYTPPYTVDKPSQPPSISGTTNGQHNAQQIQRVNVFAGASRRPSTDQSVSMESTSEAEGDVDDITTLDIPDIPNSIALSGGKQPQLVELPLPAVSDSDEIGKYTPPSEQDTRIKSKYQNAKALESLGMNIRESSDFDLVSNDPIFLIFEPMQESSNSSSSARSRSRSPIAKVSTCDTEVTQRSTTPVYKDEYRQDAKHDGSFDPFDPSNGDLEHILEIASPPQKPAIENKVPPPPPPPPEYHRFDSWKHHGQTIAVSPTHSQTRYMGNASGSPGYKTPNMNYSGQSKGSNHGSPTEDRSNRKRKYNIEDDLDDRVKRRRQYDDVTPKLKRNQPKVAEAYGRRW